MHRVLDVRADAAVQVLRGVRDAAADRRRPPLRGGDRRTGVAVLARALPVIRDIVTAHAGGQVLVVSHKATLRLVLSSLLAFDPRGYRDRLDQAPACLNVVDFRDPVRGRLMLFNDTSHYAERPRVAEQALSKWWDRP